MAQICKPQVCRSITAPPPLCVPSYLELVFNPAHSLAWDSKLLDNLPPNSLLGLECFHNDRCIWVWHVIELEVR